MGRRRTWHCPACTPAPRGPKQTVRHEHPGPHAATRLRGVHGGRRRHPAGRAGGRGPARRERRGQGARQMLLGLLPTTGDVRSRGPPDRERRAGWATSGASVSDDLTVAEPRSARRTAPPCRRCGPLADSQGRSCATSRSGAPFRVLAALAHSQPSCSTSRHRASTPWRAALWDDPQAGRAQRRVGDDTTCRRPAVRPALLMSRARLVAQGSAAGIIGGTRPGRCAPTTGPPRSPR